MQKFDKLISDSYEFDIKDMFASKDGFIIRSSNGKKLLKKVSISPERVLFVHGAKEHLYNNTFESIDRYSCTISGNPFIIIDGSCYTVSEFIEGKECNFDNNSDVALAARTLGKLHEASKGYVSPPDARIQNDIGNLPYFFSKRLEELRKLKKKAGKGKTGFDHLFLRYFDHFYKAGECVLSQIKSSSYDAVCDMTRESGIFCHHDYTYHNIILNNEDISVINFDYCCFELKVYDIANFLRRKMRKCDWDVKEASEIIKEYRTVSSISQEEFQIMKYILQFPQKYWRVANRFYNTRRSWSAKSFLSRLQEVVDEAESHSKFIERFEEIM